MMLLAIARDSQARREITWRTGMLVKAERLPRATVPIITTPHLCVLETQHPLIADAPTAVAPRRSRQRGSQH